MMFVARNHVSSSKTYNYQSLLLIQYLSYHMQYVTARVISLVPILYLLLLTHSHFLLVLHP